MLKPIILYGPTAVGKSTIAVELAKQISGEIISADSMQIYRDLNIGSAKITTSEMQNIAHHLIDIKDSLEEFSVFEFVSLCKKSIADIYSRGNTPIIVGGTGLYIKALIEDYDYGNTPKQNNYRETLNEKNLEQLYEMLKEKDLQKAQNIGTSDKKRLIRALEILNNNQIASKQEHYNDFLMFGLVADRAKLYEKINNRVDKMFNDGLLKEVEFLVRKGATSNTQSLKAIGYKECLLYLKGEQTLEQCKQLIKQKSRNYAKRQFTFMNQFPNMERVEVTDIKNTVDEIIKRCAI